MSFGSDFTNVSFQLNPIIGAYDVTQISFDDTGNQLAEPKFKSLLRVGESNVDYASAVVNLIRYYNWKTFAIYRWQGGTDKERSYNIQTNPALPWRASRAGRIGTVTRPVPEVSVNGVNDLPWVTDSGNDFVPNYIVPPVSDQDIQTSLQLLYETGATTFVYRSCDATVVGDGLSYTSLSSAYAACKANSDCQGVSDAGCVTNCQDPPCEVSGTFRLCGPTNAWEVAIDSCIYEKSTCRSKFTTSIWRVHGWCCGDPYKSCLVLKYA